MSQAIGGQAVLEGVMMRGPRNWAVAVRKPDGEIAHVAKPIDPLMARHWALRLPIVRGVVALGESLSIGGWFVLVEGLIRVTVFVLYLTVLSFIPSLRRVFQYHAAEHKAINAYEAGEELTPEVAQRYSLIHPRCGTAFLLWVMVVSVFVYALLGRPVWYWLIVTRVGLLLPIVGVAYELIRFAGKHADNRVLMTVLAPGLWLQRLTTREPTLDMLEVSIKALREVLVLEGRDSPADRRVEVMA